MLPIFSASPKRCQSTHSPPFGRSLGVQREESGQIPPTLTVLGQRSSLRVVLGQRPSRLAFSVQLSSNSTMVILSCRSFDDGWVSTAVPLTMVGQKARRISKDGHTGRHSVCRNEAIVQLSTRNLNERLERRSSPPF